MKKSVLFFMVIFISIMVFSAEEIQLTSKNQTKVQVIPVPEMAINGKNTIWCGTFQLAWNELIDKIIKEPLTFEKKISIVEPLNKKSFTKNMLDKNMYLADAGYGGENIVEKINKELKNKFPKKDLLKDKIGKKDILAYAYLYKLLEFAEPFDKLEPDSFNDSSSAVKYYGFVEEYSQARRQGASQVNILYYKPHEYIVKLETKDETDEYILAMVEPEKTLLATYNKVQKLISSTNEDWSFDSIDEFKAPFIDLNITRTFDELEKIKIINKNFKDYVISKAYQNIKFKADEKGATIESEAKIIVSATAMANEPEPKYLYFDHPFMVILKNKTAKMPYFLLWIQNDYLLVSEK